jgi:hypothetical protein
MIFFHLVNTYKIFFLLCHEWTKKTSFDIGRVWDCLNQNRDENNRESYPNVFYYFRLFENQATKTIPSFNYCVPQPPSRVFSTAGDFPPITPPVQSLVCSSAPLHCSRLPPSHSPAAGLVGGDLSSPSALALGTITPRLLLLLGSLFTPIVGLGRRRLEHSPTLRFGVRPENPLVDVSSDLEADVGLPVRSHAGHQEIRRKGGRFAHLP